MEFGGKVIRKPLYQFAHRMLPEQFLRQPSRWMTRLGGSGGQKQLEQLWTAQAPCYDHGEQVEYEPIRYYFEQIAPPWQLILLEFHRPVADGEPLIAALAWRPAQPVFLVFSSRAEARYFVTERTSDTVKLIEWDQQGGYEQHGSLANEHSSTLLTALEGLLGN